jgi:uncharacterized protein (TIGR02996 family)
MTIEDAFLQAILETPVDDLPRLAYADWLEEQGDPRGEFIHVQCRLTRMDAEDDMRFELEEREDELLRRHQDEWLGELRPLLRYWTFDRGFLDTIQVPVAVYLAEGEIARPATVRRLEVDLTGHEVPVPVLEFMPESVARENILLPLAFDRGTLVVAMSNPKDALLLAKLEFIFVREVKAVAAPVEQLVDAIDRLYFPPHFDGGPLGEYPESVATMNAADDIREDDELENGASMSRLIGFIIAEAIAVLVTGARFEAWPDRILVRYATGNEWIERDTVPIRLWGDILVRISFISGIESAEDGEQSGRIHWSENGRGTDIEVAIQTADGMPTIVLRVERGPAFTDEPPRPSSPRGPAASS